MNQRAEQWEVKWLSFLEHPAPFAITYLSFEVTPIRLVKHTTGSEVQPTGVPVQWPCHGSRTQPSRAILSD